MPKKESAGPINLVGRESGIAIAVFQILASLLLPESKPKRFSAPKGFGILIGVAHLSGQKQRIRMF